MTRTDTQHTVVIMSDNDVRFRSVIRDIEKDSDGNELGFAVHNGLSYLVTRYYSPVSIGKTWYGRPCGPDVTTEYVKQFMQDFLANS